MSSSATSGPGPSRRPSGESDVFHDLVADLDYPMVVVTAASGGERSGCLVGFSTQCSIDPPRYLVFVSKANHTHGVAVASSVLAVHVLDERDRHTAEIFGELTGDVIDKLSLLPWTEGPGGPPVLDGTAGWFAGRVLEQFDGGDHTGFLLEPFAGEKRRDVSQLGFQDVRDLDPGHAP